MREILTRARKTHSQAGASNSAVSCKRVVSRNQTRIYSCVKCGKAFNKPISLTVQAKGSVETYYACPYCFSRVSVADRPEKDLKEDAEDFKRAAPANCRHFFGYLRTRPQRAPIPDECLTCGEVMDCM